MRNALPLAAVLDRLNADVERLRGGGHELVGLTGSTTELRGQNAGLAVGPLRSLGPEGDPRRIARKASALVSALRGRARRAEDRASRASERMHAGVGRFLERCSSRLERLAGQLESDSPALGRLSHVLPGFRIPSPTLKRINRATSIFSPVLAEISVIISPTV